jgi:hypothetical protein
MTTFRDQRALVNPIIDLDQQLGDVGKSSEKPSNIMVLYILQSLYVPCDFNEIFSINKPCKYVVTTHCFAGHICLHYQC